MEKKQIKVAKFCTRWIRGMKVTEIDSLDHHYSWNHFDTKGHKILFMDANDDDDDEPNQ